MVVLSALGPQKSFLRQTQLGTNGTKIADFAHRSDSDYKERAFAAQQLTFRRLCQQRTVGNGEDHVV